MTMQKKYIEDENGNKVLPITHFSAVKNSSGDTLEDVLYTESTYDPTTYSGMGRKVLQKNMVNGVNTLTQSMMPVATGGNTIYIIRYDFTIGENITVPANCVLEFDGGSISGAYTITGQNTGINAGLVKIFNTDITLSGSWNVAEAYPEWFGSASDGTTDDTAAIQKTLNSFDIVKLVSSNGYAVYPDNEGICIRMAKGKQLIGTKREATAAQHKAQLLVHGTNVTGILGTGLNTIKNLSIKGVDVTGFDQQRIYTSIGIKIKDRSNYLERVDTMTFHIGFELECFEATVLNCVAMISKVGFYCHGETNNKWYENGGVTTSENTSTTLIGCYVMSSTTEGYVFQGMSYSSLINCAADGCGIPFEDVAITNQDNIFYPYFFTHCTSCSIISCGAEVCGVFMKIHRSAGISVKNCCCLLDFRISSEDNVNPHSILIAQYSTGIAYDSVIVRKGSNITVSNDLFVIEDAFITILFVGNMGGTLGGNLLTGRNNISNWGGANNWINVIPTVKMKGDLASIPDPYAVGIGNIYIETTNNKPLFNLGNKWVYADGSDIPT